MRGIDMMIEKNKRKLIIGETTQKKTDIFCKKTQEGR